jgi:hypothetical protein
MQYEGALWPLDNFEVRKAQFIADGLPLGARR